MQMEYEKVGVLPITDSKVQHFEHWPFVSGPFLSDERPTLETLYFTIRIGSTPTFSYFHLYLYSAYAAHYVYCV